MAHNTVSNETCPATRIKAHRLKFPSELLISIAKQVFLNTFLVKKKRFSQNLNKWKNYLINAGSFAIQQASILYLNQQFLL